MTNTHTLYDMGLGILCAGVNFRDRTVEYTDGSARPKYMSPVPRVASGFNGRDRSLIHLAESHSMDKEGEEMAAQLPRRMPTIT